MIRQDPSYVLGLDCGTTNIKGIVLRSDGQVVAEASRKNTTYHVGPGAVEQNANEWWENTAAIFRSLTETVGNHICSLIKGLSISSHTVSMLALDEERNPLRPALTCQDGRSWAELEWIVDQMGHDHFVSIVGGQPAAAFLPNKILWFKKHEPELYKKTHFYAQASSFLNMKLTGVLVTDLDQGIRTQCLDVNTLTWSKEIGDLLGVDLEKVMPPLRMVDTIIGYVTKDASLQTGLPAGIPVLAGCSDAYASIYAMGMNKLGDAGESSGTTSLIFAGCHEMSGLNIPVITRPCNLGSIPWLFDAPIQSTGASLNWFIEMFGNEERVEAKKAGINIYSLLNQKAVEAPAGSGGLFFYPYLMGERAPLWNDYARGMFIGLNMNMDRRCLIRSVFEGTAYAMRHVVETIKESGAQIETMRVCGGGARSRTWNMIKASMLNIPILVIDENSGDIPVGDALLAGHKTGVFPDLAKAMEDIVKIKEVIYPIKEWTQVYNKLYPFYVEMYERLDDSLKRLKGVMER